MKSPSPEVKNQILLMRQGIEGLKVEFDEHFKNKITMICIVPKIEFDELKLTLSQNADEKSTEPEK